MSPSSPVAALFEGDIAGVEWVDESPARSEEREVFDVAAGPGTSPHWLLCQAAAHLVRLLLCLATPLRQLCSPSQGNIGGHRILPAGLDLRPGVSF